MTHTPGPWTKRAAPYGFDIVVLDNETDRALWVASITTGLLGRESPYYPTKEACDANAGLISTVPELLAALQAVQKIISEAALTGFNCHDGDWAERLFHSQQATSAAIKRATAIPSQHKQDATT